MGDIGCSVGRREECGVGGGKSVVWEEGRV